MLVEKSVNLVGNTPMVKLNKIVGGDSADVYVKLEGYNASGSVKARAALGMIEAAEAEGLLKPGSVIIEPTSGNTGIALAMIGKMKGYDVVITMPDTMSVERRNILKAYGAQLILTDGQKGMKGAIDKAIELAEEDSKYFVPQQFDNINNPEKHYATTAVEIINDLKAFDAFVSGVGTGGTIAGVGKKLKEYDSSIKVVAVEPSESAVLSGGSPGPHKIQGIGAGFIPVNYKAEFVDEVITVSTEEAAFTAKALLDNEGLFLGISSGASIAAALKLAKRLGKGKKVVVISPDGGEKYISMGIYY